MVTNVCVCVCLSACVWMTVVYPHKRFTRCVQLTCHGARCIHTINCTSQCPLGSYSQLVRLTSQCPGDFGEGGVMDL